MNPVLAQARDRLLAEDGAVFVAAYGSFASGAEVASSDVDLVAWAPVAVPVHRGGLVAGHELDAWVYPLDHPFTDPDLARVQPALVLHDPGGRARAFEAAVKATREEAHRPLDAAAKADLQAWADKMVARARSGTVEGLQRYHWLLSEGPELWCRLGDHPWEGPQKALTRMKTEAPALYRSFGELLGSAPDVRALEGFLKELNRV